MFDDSWSTQRVYESTTKELVDKALQGFNTTVFAYGQTSSGKTHTMRGTPAEPGIIPLAVSRVFELIEETAQRDFLVKVSYMEIYNEEINDLLAPENTRLTVQESREHGVHVVGLREEVVRSPSDVLALLEEGDGSRKVGETKMNKNSSRSHTIFRMSLASSAKVSDGESIWMSALTLVDLAGSERISKTGAEGMRKKEGAAINKSLLTLGTVINKLAEGALGHVPYRDSKLTRILQPSLGGNARTAVICNVTPASCHLDETHSTLRFACRAKKVVNHSQRNEVLSDAALLERQEKEIARLRAQLKESKRQSSRKSSGSHSNDGSEESEELLELRARIAQYEEQLKFRGLTGLGGEFVPGARQALRSRRATMSTLSDRDFNAPAGECAGAAQTSKGPLLPPSRCTHPWPRSAPAGLLGAKRSLLEAGEGPGSGLSPLGKHARIHEGGPQGAVAPEKVAQLEAQVSALQAQAAALESELGKVTSERDRMAPQLQEALWKVRTLQKKVTESEESSPVVDESALARLRSELEAARSEASRLSSELELAREEKGGVVSSLEADLEATRSALGELRETAARLEVEAQEARGREAALEARVGEVRGSLEEARAEKEEVLERAERAEAQLLEADEENKRLEAHCKDLEGRKRAPLYQYKQVSRSPAGGRESGGGRRPAALPWDARLATMAAMGGPLARDLPAGGGAEGDEGEDD